MQSALSMKRRISVIIVTFNRFHLLREALASCYRQHNAEALEVIVVDNGSSDATPRIGEYFPSIRYVRTERTGIAQARNLALRYARSPHLAFLDSDDVFFPEKLSLQQAALEENDADLVFSDYYVAKEGALWRYPFEQLKSRFWESMFPYGSSALFFTRRCLEAVGDFDTELVVGEDWDFFVRCAKRHRRIVRIPRPLYVYRHHDQNISFSPSIDHEGYWQRIRRKNGLPNGLPLTGYNRPLISASSCVPRTRGRIKSAQPSAHSSRHTE